MHILIIHQAFAALNEPGGTRHYEFARKLASCGHRVTIIASPVNYITGTTRTEHVRWLTREEPESGITILRTYVYRAHHKSFHHRMWAFFSFMVSSFFVGLGVKNVDLVWGTSPPIFQAISALALTKLKRVPFLLEVRDLWPYFAVAVGVLTSWPLIRMSEWLERFLYRGADRVMVNSPGFISHVRCRGAKRVELIPNGSDSGMFAPDMDGADFRRLHGLEGKFVLLYAGAHGLSNDLDVVLDAAEQLRDRPEIQIVLLGDGKEKPRLQARAAGMGLENVTFLDSVSKSEVPSALAAADACIAILKPIEAYKTTYPNKVFDYMAAGRPIVLAIDGVIREAVEAAECGIFTQPGDPSALAEAIQTLASDKEKARQMGQKGRAYLEEHFNRAVISEKLVRLLEEMLNEGR